MTGDSWIRFDAALQEFAGRRWPKYAQASPDDKRCICPFVDVGVGPLMQHGVDPDCPACNPEPHLVCSCEDWGWLFAYTWGDAREGDEIDPGCPIHGE